MPSQGTTPGDNSPHVDAPVPISCAAMFKIRGFIWQVVGILLLQELAERNSAGRKPGTLRALQGTRWADFAERQPCGFLHEGQTCNQHLLTYVPQEFLRALPV